MLSSGFFNSVSHDRKYNAEQMSAIFNGIINDGVFINIGDHFAVTENAGMVVNVGVGRAWFDGIWAYNDAAVQVTVPDANIIYDRIDTLFIKIDKSLAVRTVSFELVSGTPGSEPERPTVINTEETTYYPLADISVAAGVTEIAQANIANRIGTSDTPFVTGILETVDVDELLVQWQAQFTSWNSQKQTEFESWESEVQSDFEDWQDTSEDSFDNWFQHLHNELDSNQAANLQRQIDENVELFTGVIEAGDTTVTIESSRIHTTSMIDVYFENKVLSPDEITVSEGEVEIRILPEETDTTVGIRILNPLTTSAI